MVPRDKLVTFGSTKCDFRNDIKYKSDRQNRMKWLI